MITEELKGHVHEVAQFLDEDVPGWPQTLVDAYGPDLHGLHFNDPEQCVLSALFGEYGHGVDVVFEARNIDVYRMVGSYTFSPVGLAVAHYWVSMQYEVTLREAWLAEINTRLTSARLS